VAKHLVFVYGTLRRGSWNHGFLAGQRLVGAGRTVEKYALYVADIPYVAKEPVSRITGEVYEVADACLAALDELEDHPHEYRREQAEIELDSGETVTAWLYFHPEPGGRLLASGDFMAI
jgi:gamma-glutamylcyclotransferase (GGCT)/AIG2-like uncharacterized protein YtfP